MKQAHVLAVAAAAGLAGVALYSFGGSDTPPETATAETTEAVTEATTASAESAAPMAEAPAAEAPGLADAEALAEIDRLAAELEGRDARIASLTDQVASLEAEIAALEEAALETADREAETADLAGAETADLLAERDARLAELETLLAERDATIADLQADLAARAEDKLAATETALPAELLAGDGTKILPDEAEPLQAALEAVGTPTQPARADAPAATAAQGPIAEVHFESGSAEITTGGQTRALAAAAVLTALPDGMIRLTGHTDTTGSPELNRRLSEERARAVADMLVSAGIPAERIEIVPHGQDAEALPIATGDGVREPLNRCVAIWPVAATG